MDRSRKTYLNIATVMAVMAIMAIGPAVSSALAAEKMHLRLGTSKEGTNGYASGVGITATVTKYLKDMMGVSMEAVPTPGSTASVKIFGKGDLDFCYANTWTLKDSYLNRGPFAKKPITRRPLQGWHYGQADWLMVTKAGRTDINSLKDLAGKKVYPFAAGTGIYDIYQVVLTELGIWDKIKRRQVGPMEVPDAMSMGTVDVVGAYCTAGGFQTAGWVRNVDARVDFKVIIPSPDEQKVISKIAGLSTYNVTKDWMGDKNKKNNPGQLWSFGLHYGFHPGSNIPTDVMYNIYKVWIEKVDELSKINSALLAYKVVGPIVNQERGLSQIPDIPVHPGVAKYLKEKGLWKDNLTVGKLAPGVK